MKTTERCFVCGLPVGRKARYGRMFAGIAHKFCGEKYYADRQAVAQAILEKVPSNSRDRQQAEIVARLLGWDGKP